MSTGDNNNNNRPSSFGDAFGDDDPAVADALARQEELQARQRPPTPPPPRSPSPAEEMESDTELNERERRQRYSQRLPFARITRGNVHFNDGTIGDSHGRAQARDAIAGVLEAADALGSTEDTTTERTPQQQQYDKECKEAREAAPRNSDNRGICACCSKRNIGNVIRCPTCHWNVCVSCGFLAKRWSKNYRFCTGCGVPDIYI